MKKAYKPHSVAVSLIDIAHFPEINTHELSRTAELSYTTVHYTIARSVVIAGILTYLPTGKYYSR